MRVNERETDRKVKLKGIEVVKVDEFKYLRLTSKAMDIAQER